MARTRRPKVKRMEFTHEELNALLTLVHAGRKDEEIGGTGVERGKCGKGGEHGKCGKSGQGGQCGKGGQSKRSRSGGMSHAERWNKRLEEAKAWVDRHGSVPSSTPSGDRPLHNWLYLNLPGKRLHTPDRWKRLNESTVSSLARAK